MFFGESGVVSCPFRLLHVILHVAVLLKLRLDLLDIRWHLDRAVQGVLKTKLL